ncbi:uncharacterized protein K02A2.6-like [Temnothorax curvispinosus]|uniref:RNA-directed DNA polymerase n=1 Tax=Temnothorax curvispinosus TaxID=300111 RepID=A0A6J1Q4C0_9HYME|nr:uncharacterized protein K02A2.6-like [Temnothorax curvispinosus]
MKKLARFHFWWPGLDKDIKRTASSCKTCLEKGKAPPHAPLTPWPWPANSWSRLHTDFLGPLFGQMYMIIIDAHSKWHEIVRMGSNMKAYKVIEIFKALFVRFGLPHHVVSDNGPQYRSEMLQAFLRENGIKQSFAAPNHPATNGVEENFVGTFKDKVTKIVKSGKTVEIAV